MSKELRETRIRERLLDANVEQKFKIAFRSVVIGFSLVAFFAFANILIYAKLAGVGVFSTFSRGVGFLLLVFGVVFNFFLIRAVSKSLTLSLVKPIFELQTAIQKMRTGDFDIDIKYESSDELGVLANELRETCAQIYTVVSDTGSLLSGMAEGRFNVTSAVPDSYIGVFETLIVAINKLNVQLSYTMRQIHTSAGNLLAGAQQLSDGAQNLADGASDQAGAVEELTATIAGVANIAEESAKNAAKAATNATTATKDAKQSREEINQLVEAMNRIIATSNEIEKIISAIEDIASQTNLLSLNASIEAARAGEAGRGFAVVADQIGKLAADSAKSAVTTRELISKCLMEVESGNSIVNNTIESFGIVLTNMESVANMASGAADASKEQADMLKQVEEGISQIAYVVQNNSATAEENSAMSEEVSTQAVKLEELVGKFALSEK